MERHVEFYISLNSVYPVTFEDYDETTHQLVKDVRDMDKLAVYIDGNGNVELCTENGIFLEYLSDTVFTVLRDLAVNPFGDSEKGSFRMRSGRKPAN